MNGISIISYSQAGGAVANDSVIYRFVSSSLRMTPSSAGTKLTLTLTVPVLKLAPRIIEVWVRKSVVGDGAAYNGNQPRLIQKANASLGQVSDVVLKTAAAAAGVWERMSGTTIAPTQDGSYDIVIDCDGTAGWVNVDEFVSVGGDPEYAPSDSFTLGGQAFPALVADFGCSAGGDGFTVFTATSPSGEGSGFTGNGTRKVHVDPVGGSDSNTGTQASPKQTYSGGFALMRPGFPDWLLFKAGSTFTGVSFSGIAGLYPSAPALISTYGTGARPIFKKTQGTDLIRVLGTHVAIVGLDFYVSSFDPGSPDYNAAHTDFSIASLLIRMSSITIEDCVFRFGALAIQPGASGVFGGVYKFRRNIVVDAYNNDAHASGHAGGMFCEEIGYGVLEQNFLDHNGWNETVGGAQTVFNHNLYIASVNGRFRVVENISARASSHGMQVRPGGYVYNNLVVHNPIGIQAGAPPFQTSDATGGPDPRGTFVQYNVVTEGNDIGANPRGFGIDLNSVNAGGEAQVANAWATSASYNLIANKTTTAGEGHGIELGSLTTGTTAQNNTIFKWDLPIRNLGSGNTTTLNKIDQNGDNVEYSFPDPTRSVGSYYATIGGDGTLVGFLNWHRSRGRGVWDDRYSAAEVNRYIRQGFGITNPDFRSRVRLTATA